MRQIHRITGVDALLRRLREKDQGLTHSEAKQLPDVADQLREQGGRVWGALEENFDFVGEHPKGNITFYARRIDPQYYQDYEDWDYGLRPDKPSAGDVAPVEVKKSFWDQVEDALKSQSKS